MLIHSIIHINNSQSLLGPYPARKGINRAVTSWENNKAQAAGLGFRPLQDQSGPISLSLKLWKTFA